jgi:hypothetical protein
MEYAIILAMFALSLKIRKELHRRKNHLHRVSKQSKN